MLFKWRSYSAEKALRAALVQVYALQNQTQLSTAEKYGLVCLAKCRRADSFHLYIVPANCQNMLRPHY